MEEVNINGIPSAIKHIDESLYNSSAALNIDYANIKKRVLGEHSPWLRIKRTQGLRMFT
jgi:hypothetical protein